MVVASAEAPAAGGGAGRQRDLFPLPRRLIASEFNSVPGKCRKTRQRAHRKAYWQQWAEEGVQTLNHLAAVGPSSSAPTAAQRAALQQIDDAYADIAAVHLDCTPQEALSELLGTAACYSDMGAGATAPYSQDLVSWPDVGASPVPLVSGLRSGDQSLMYGWREHMLRDPVSAASLKSELGLSRVHCDPGLLRSPTVYGACLFRMFLCGMLRWN